MTMKEIGDLVRRASLAALASLAAAASLATACGDSADNAKPRTGENGCIGEACYDAAAPSADGGPGADGSSPTDAESDTGSDGPTAYPDPLEGTTKQATLIKGGFQFTEGPVWIGGRLLFSDIGNANTIYELQGTNTVAFRTNSGGANGNAVDNNGKLVTCEGTNKRVVRSDATQGAATTPIAATFGAANAPLNAPNDVVVRKDGNVYFTDPNYSGQPNTQDAEAVYRISPGGNLTRVPQAFNKPNGIALSPDGNRLYVVDNGAGTLLAAPVNTNGGIAQNAFTKVADVPGGDGMAVDDAGNLYVADNAGIDVFDKAGKKLGTIAVAVKPANCTFGGNDRRTLYITANGGGGNPATGLYAITLNVPGLP
jgi:gluconolactonase